MINWNAIVDTYVCDMYVCIQNRDINNGGNKLEYDEPSW